MAPFPENNTTRLWVDYTSVGIKHSVMHRYAGIANTTTANVVATVLIDFYKGLLPTTDGILGARVSFEGTDFSIDLPNPAEAGTGTGATWVEDADSAFVTLPIRGVGTKNKGLICFYAPLSFGQAWPPKNRYGPGQNALWNGIHDDWITNIEHPIADVDLVNIANDNVNFKGYLNFRKNGYAQTKQRV